MSVLKERLTSENGVCITKKIGRVRKVSVLQERCRNENSSVYEERRISEDGVSIKKKDL